MAAESSARSDTAFSLRDVERYMAQQWELIASAVKTQTPLRPTIVHDAMAEIMALEEIVKRMRNANGGAGVRI